MINCRFCRKEVKPLGKSMHERFCHMNPEKCNKGFGGAKKGCIPWNKGANISDVCKQKISESLKGKATGKASSEILELERRNRISNTMKNNPKSGGIRIGSGRGKKGYYKGYWCDSTWELAWVIYNIDHGIEFVRNDQGFFYDYLGKTYKYYPDFIIGNIYYEIKGRRSFSDLDEKTKAKIRSFEGQLEVLFSKEMENILEYVSTRYGKNFYNLYETHKD